MSFPSSFHVGRSRLQHREGHFIHRAKPVVMWESRFLQQAAVDLFRESTCDGGRPAEMSLYRTQPTSLVVTSHFKVNCAADDSTTTCCLAVSTFSPCSVIFSQYFRLRVFIDRDSRTLSSSKITKHCLKSQIYNINIECKRNMMKYLILWLHTISLKIPKSKIKYQTAKYNTFVNWNTYHAKYWRILCQDSCDIISCSVFISQYNSPHQMLEERQTWNLTLSAQRLQILNLETLLIRPDDADLQIRIQTTLGLYVFCEAVIQHWPF